MKVHACTLFLGNPVLHKSLTIDYYHKHNSLPNNFVIQISNMPEIKRIAQ